MEIFWWWRKRNKEEEQGEDEDEDVKDISTQPPVAFGSEPQQLVLDGGWGKHGSP